MNRFRAFTYKVSKNHTRTCWVLKCEIRKFFASVDQTVLLDIVSTYIPDKKIVALTTEIVTSFPLHERCQTSLKVGLPLGNLTSQLLVNVYMNEFDQFVKHKLKAKYYVRYADDFVILSWDKTELEVLLPKIASFLGSRLKLSLHPDKVSIRTFASGVDFLGWVHFPDHRVLRTSTKRRMGKRLQGSDASEASRESYRGMLKHGNGRKLTDMLERCQT